LRFPFVTHLEGIACEVRREPAISIYHSHKDTDGVTRAAEDRLLPDGRTKCAQETRGERPRRKKPNHAHYSLVRRPGTELQSYHKMSEARGSNRRDLGQRTACRRILTARVVASALVLGVVVGHEPHAAVDAAVKDVEAWLPFSQPFLPKHRRSGPPYSGVCHVDIQHESVYRRVVCQQVAPGADLSLVSCSDSC